MCTGRAAVLALLFLSEFCCGTTITSSFLSSSEKSRLHQVFTSSIDVNDLPATYYAVLGLKSQNAPVPNDKVCNK